MGAGGADDDGTVLAGHYVRDYGLVALYVLYPALDGDLLVALVLLLDCLHVRLVLYSVKILVKAVN